MPSTSWVALAPRAKSSSAVGTSSPPTTVWKLAPTSSASAPQLRDRRRRGADQPVAAQHVHGEQIGRPGALGDPRRAAQHRLALLVAGQRDDHPLAGLPDLLHVLLGAVALHGDVDLVGHPQQRQLPQRGEVARLEVVRERGVDLLGGVDVAVREPAPQRLGGDVDQLQLLRAADDLVGHGLPLPHTGDPLDDVVERLQVLDVDRGDHVDARVEQVLDVLPALGVPGSGRVGVGELVDERHLGLAGEHGVEVHLVEPVRRRTARGDDLQPVEELGGLRPAVGLDQPDHDVRAALQAAARFPQHRERLADARRHAEVDAQLACAWSSPSSMVAGIWPTARFSSVTFTVGSPRKPRTRPSVACATSSCTRSTRQPGHPRDPGDLQRRVGGADVAGRGPTPTPSPRRRAPLTRGTPSRAAICCLRWLIVSSSFWSNVPLLEPPDVEVSAGPRTSFAEADGRVWKNGSGPVGHRVDPDQRRPDGRPSCAYTTEPSAGPERPGEPGHRPGQERVGDAREHGEDEKDAQAGGGLAPQCGDHQIPGISRTSRSMRKIPTKGVTTPPRP